MCCTNEKNKRVAMLSQPIFYHATKQGENTSQINHEVIGKERAPFQSSICWKRLATPCNFESCRTQFWRRNSPSNTFGSSFSQSVESIVAIHEKEKEKRKRIMSTEPADRFQCRDPRKPKSPSKEKQSKTFPRQFRRWAPSATAARVKSIERDSSLPCALQRLLDAPHPSTGSEQLRRQPAELRYVSIARYSNRTRQS